MRGLWLVVLCGLGCAGNKNGPPSSTETASPTGVDTAGDTADSASPDDSDAYGISMVASTSMPGLPGVRGSVMEPGHGNSFVFGSSGTTIRMLTSSWIHPSGSYCVGGSFDEEEVCRGGEVWASGRIDSPQPTMNHCMDRERQELVLLKQGGQNIEVIDVGMQGPEASSYLRVSQRLTLPPSLAVSQSYAGPCTVLPTSGHVVVSSIEQQAVAVVERGEDPTVVRKNLLPFRTGSMAVFEDRLVIAEATGNRFSLLDSESLEPTFQHRFTRPIGAMAVDHSNGAAWFSVGASRIEWVDLNAPDRRRGFDLSGRVIHLVVDPAHGLAWAVIEADESSQLVMMDASGVLAEKEIEGTVLGLGEPAPTGDVPVYVAGAAEDSVRAVVFAPEMEEPDVPPLYGFLFTTIEEPSDLKMDQDCLGEDNSFAREMALVRNNAAALAALEIPVALAISDNFTQKAKECGETGIFAELAAHGFHLGVLIHNRPCYHCTDGIHESNPDSCTRSSPHWSRANSPSACFPNDPEYCALGDWECYRDHVSPRIDLVDRNLPGGGDFIVGADRHRMWDYDWVRLYREVERSSVDRTGFDLTMFANTWAYDGIAFNDPRGKNMAPWDLAQQTTPWRIGDVRHWDADAPLSDLVYLPGNSTSTIKMAEYGASGLFMIDFFTADIPLAYQTNDFDVAWQALRTAMSQRREGVTNTWYFHVHDLGLINLRDKNGNSLHYDPDGEEGPMEPIPNERLLQEFVDKIDAEFGSSGSFVWSDPQRIRSMIAP